MYGWLDSGAFSQYDDRSENKEISIPFSLSARLRHRASSSSLLLLLLFFVKRHSSAFRASVSTINTTVY
jgi:hypothetical protein